MGNVNMLKNDNRNFIEQIKVDASGKSKILGIYINQNEFPKSGLIVVSTKGIYTYNPVYGNINNFKNLKKEILYVTYNKKSREGSILVCVTSDMKCYFLSTENLSINQIINVLTNTNLKIKDNSLISCINFQLNDALLIACTDGSVIKCKLNEEPVNLLYEFKENLFKNPEDEFVSITNVFSNLLDNWVDDSFFTIKEDNDIDNNDKNNNLFQKNKLSAIEEMHISNKYKVLFCCHKMVSGKSNISLFDLRTNVFTGIFCKIKGIIRCSTVNDKRNTLLIITLEPEKKKTQLEVWKYEENSCPVGTYDFSNLIDYSFTINSFYVKSIPDIFNNIIIGEENNKNIIEMNDENKLIKEKIDKDIITLGTSKGDIIIGEISISPFNNQPNFKHIMTYKLHKNEDLEIEDVSNKYEISFIAYDFNFDMVYFGDISSNVRFIEKVLQLGQSYIKQENFPLFSLDYENNIYENNDKKIKKRNEFLNELDSQTNYELPYLSMSHDIIKDRNIIYTAVAMAMRALKNKEVRRIVLTRPAVEAGESLGFLPGDLRDMIPQQKLLSYWEDNTIEIAPLAFMRGRTLDNAFVILDEAQNATSAQLKMFLTRMGRNAKFVVTGDLTQVDLPRHQQSGLLQAVQILKGIKGIDVIELDNSDVVRHRLVTEIIKAYDSIS